MTYQIEIRENNENVQSRATGNPTARHGGYNPRNYTSESRERKFYAVVIEEDGNEMEWSRSSRKPTQYPSTIYYATPEAAIKAVEKARNAGEIMKHRCYPEKAVRA